MIDAESLTFATANDADVAEITNLVRAAYARWIPVLGREPRPMVADYAAAVQNRRFDLCRRGTSLVGLLETEVRTGEDSRNHLWIENIAVAPPLQGKGIGRRLLAHAETLARDAGLAEIRLLTNGAFEANVRLYEGVGYRITHSEPFMGGTTLYFSKTI